MARADNVAAGAAIRGAALVARQAATFAQFAQSAQLASVNGGVGVVALFDDGFRVMLFSIPSTRITQVSVLTTPTAVADLDVLIP